MYKNNYQRYLLGLNPNFFRPEGVQEYPISSLDLKFPIHKLSFLRYISTDLYKSKPPLIVGTFFFNFYLFIPVKNVWFNSSLSDLGINLLKAPFEIDFPILFEFLLLKFTIFSMFFSFSNPNLYDFYSLGLVESLCIRFRSILDKIIISLFKLF